MDMSFSKWAPPHIWTPLTEFVNQQYVKVAPFCGTFDCPVVLPLIFSYGDTSETLCIAPKVNDLHDRAVGLSLQ
jgi:hypothetical protein